jgi:endonuclease/exonuclease/phosphatase family metal-dependent hydrolase
MYHCDGPSGPCYKCEVERLRAELADAQSHIVKLQEVWEDTRNQRDALRAIVKEQTALTKTGQWSDARINVALDAARKGGA